MNLADIKGSKSATKGLIKQQAAGITVGQEYYFFKLYKVNLTFNPIHSQLLGSSLGTTRAGEVFENFPNGLRMKDTQRQRTSSFEQYATNSMTAITKDLVRNIPTDNYLWEYGDTYQKIAARYYDDPEMWWVIAWFNQKPAEFMLNVGDTILIPLELVDILRFYGY